VAELLLDQHRVDGRQATAPVFGGDVHCVEAEGPGFLEDFTRLAGRELPRGLDRVLERDELGLDEAPNRFHDQTLLVAQSEFHVPLLVITAPPARGFRKRVFPLTMYRSKMRYCFTFFEHCAVRRSRHGSRSTRRDESLLLAASVR
jgi:hypothetical protein